MKLIALTGGIACGKTTVANELRKNSNVVIIDADQIGKTALDKGQKPYEQLKQHIQSNERYSNQYNQLFNISNDTNNNQEIEGTVNRELLGSLVFRDDSLRKTLNGYTHGWIFKRIISAIWEQYRTTSNKDDGDQEEKIVVLDMPLFFETKVFSHLVSKVIVVTTTPDRQKSFLMSRNNLSEEEAINRMKAQMPNEIKEQRADYIIRNDSTLEQLQRETRKKFELCVGEADPFGWSFSKMGSTLAAATLYVFYASSYLLWS